MTSRVLGDRRDLGAAASVLAEPPLMLGLQMKSCTRVSQGVAANAFLMAVLGEFTPSLYSVLHRHTESHLSSRLG